MNFDINNLLRSNIRDLKPYSSARDEFTGTASVYLDANENSLGSPLKQWYNRYPDPLQTAVKEKLAAIKAVPAGNIFIGNGSDECIDILIRSFVEPGRDNILICPPTYGMYEVSAAINNVKVIEVPLTATFQLDLPAIEAAINPFTKIIFLCSPNNPTGNALHRQEVELLLHNFDGLVVLDEAYINFSRHRSFTTQLEEHPNLVVMQTLSKAWGLAALRLGMAFAAPAIIEVMNKVKPPYNINLPSQQLALQALEEVGQVNDMIRELIAQREFLERELPRLPVVLKVHPSEANFLLVKVNDPDGIYNKLLGKGIVVRNRSRLPLCEGCLRITVGTAAENEKLLQALAQL